MIKLLSRKPTALFFFSSRRRHTRSLRDWSSDVCSSDLGSRDATIDLATSAGCRVVTGPAGRGHQLLREIGRASCRERGADEAGVTEVRTSLSEKKFELWREIKV